MATTQRKAKKNPASGLQEIRKENGWSHVLSGKPQTQWEDKYSPDIPIDPDYHYDSSAVIQFIQEMSLRKQKKGVEI